MAETNSLLNCRTGYCTGGSNPPLSAMDCIRVPPGKPDGTRARFLTFDPCSSGTSQARSPFGPLQNRGVPASKTEALFQSSKSLATKYGLCDHANPVSPSSAMRSVKLFQKHRMSVKSLCISGRFDGCAMLSKFANSTFSSKLPTLHMVC